MGGSIIKLKFHIVKTKALAMKPSIAVVKTCNYDILGGGLYFSLQRGCPRFLKFSIWPLVNKFMIHPLYPHP